MQQCEVFVKPEQLLARQVAAPTIILRLWQRLLRSARLPRRAGVTSCWPMRRAVIFILLVRAGQPARPPCWSADLAGGLGRLRLRVRVQAPATAAVARRPWTFPPSCGPTCSARRSLASDARRTHHRDEPEAGAGVRRGRRKARLAALGPDPDRRQGLQGRRSRCRVAPPCMRFTWTACCWTAAAASKHC